MSNAGERSATSQRLDKLTPAQRALLERRLMERQGAVARRRAISRREGDGPAPLSYAQELLWLLSQVFDYGIAYNAPGAFQLEGSLDLDVLARAFSALSERHAILRTTYSVIDGQPMQIAQPTGPIEINVVDLGGLPADERYAQAQQILKEESRFPFDLERGPVIRPTVIRFTDDEHILMLNLHHIATDGYSRGVLYRDLTALYGAFAQGRPSPLAPLQIQYADFAVWQRDWLDDGIADAQIDYWKRKLARMPSRLELPTDFPRPPVRSDVGANMSTSLDQELREGLRGVARQCDATLFVALLSLFATLLSRYSGQDDLVIGTPFAGRNRTELESMVGYFINPLALRIDLSGDPSFAELVRRTRTTVLDAFAHADVAYETVVRAINPQRDMSQTPVFQAMIVMHNPVWQTQRPKFEPPGIRCTEITHEKGWAKFDVLLGMSERKTGLNTTWEYSTELFKPTTIQRMMAHLGTLAESAVSDPSRRLSQLSMLSEQERGRAMFAWNPQSDPLAERESIKELFEEQVQRTPEATAIVFADARLTYDELNRRANRIAWMLREQGAAPGTRVAIMMDKSLDLLPALLGVVKSGAAYIPIDPSYPRDRVEFMLQDAAPAVVLTRAAHVSAVPPTAAEIVAIDAPGLLSPMSEENPPHSASADDLAYVIYTSGSTGQPKGVMIANRSLVSLHFAHRRAYRLHELKAHLQLASFSFDVFTGDVVRALLSGAKLVLCPIEVVIDGAAVYELMLREGIDAAEFVPATATLLFEWVHQSGKRLDHMRLLIVGSEAWRYEKYAFFKSLCGPSTRLINSYGLTEATIDSTLFELEDTADIQPARLVPIGRPLDNTRVYVLDTNLEPQAIGIAGELCIGGVAVGRGYLNQPELTATKFVPDPFSDRPGALLYRTGDRARWLADGNIEFMGRVDRQLKIRGFRIEPGEIESILEQRPEIRTAAVTGREDPTGQTRLVAYLQSAGASRPAASDLRAFLSEHVPNYMVPSLYIALAEIPLTPNGKVDLDALPEPEWDRAAVADAFVAPRTDSERTLAEIWSRVLSVPEVGANDNFFALGGHSLVAMQVMSRVRDELGVALKLRAIFDAPTVAELALAVDGAARLAPVQTAPPLVRITRTRM
ncbi:MAG: hypothetical protein QOG59_2748 [Solirubrobacteraceae bacterium]|nr:hypothetical protein [Solirubrobacteraceae bacterium]